jgi:hypothetical protein
MRRIIPLLAVAVVGVSVAVVVTALRRRAASDLAVTTAPGGDGVTTGW